MMSAICVQKGGIATENYAGRFFAADTLEFVYEYGRRLLEKNKTAVPSDVAAVIEKFREQYEQVKDLTTPTQKLDYATGFKDFCQIGDYLDTKTPLAFVCAQDEASFAQAQAELRAAV